MRRRRAPRPNAANAAQLAGHYPLQTADLANGAVTLAKLASGLIVTLLCPTYHVSTSNAQWTPTVSPAWDISQYLTAAGVPSGVSQLLLGWQPTDLADWMSFNALDANGNSLGSINYAALLSFNGSYTAPYAGGAPVGSMVVVPGATTQINYAAHGGFVVSVGTGFNWRGLGIYGYVQ